MNMKLSQINNNWNILIIVVAMAMVCSMIGAASGAAVKPIAIPAQGDWSLRGTAMVPGVAGAWDTRLHGQISPCAVLKIEGRFFLYYVGADGDRSTDQGPRYRALGLAVSDDGLSYTSDPGNPVLTYLPHRNEEEGIFSAGAALGTDGDVIVHYGAIWARDAVTESVHCNVALATGPGPGQLKPAGDVLRWDDHAVWGWGDEISPVGTLFDGREWHVYYISKGHTGPWKLALASGPAPDRMIKTRPVINDGPFVIGGCNPVPISAERIALFIVRDFEENLIEVRSAPLIAPHDISDVVQTYRFPGYRHTAVLLDRDSDTWFMYQRETAGNHVVVRTAPARVE